MRRNPSGFPPAATQSKAVLREEMMARRIRDIETRRGLFVSPEEIRAYYDEQQQLLYGSRHTPHPADSPCSRSWMKPGTR